VTVRRPWLFLLLSLSAPALAADISYGYTPTLGATDKPAFTLTPPRNVLSLQVIVTAGSHTYNFAKANVPAGKLQRFEWARDPAVTDADVHLLVEYEDRDEEEITIPIHYSYGGQLKVDLSRASADVHDRTVTVGVTAHVDSADITAYGAHKAVIDQSTVTLDAGPGQVSVPWVGNPGDVVLLDVTLHSGGAWSGFTYSPWFLDIPHDDVLFETDQSTIRPEEDYKLKATLDQLKDVLDKYGEVVPVKLYIAGCTDTTGEAGHNLELSRNRARSIATWLRAHGYSKPIFYHGFGESWLADATPDGTDDAANRRAVYMVGANPPPSGSGVPAVQWTPL
jgi:outer membrane protein OmpA-like peptidoglycan-associated protein